MKKGTKGHNGDPTISFEVVALRDPAGLSKVPGAISALFSANSAAAYVRGFEKDAVVKIEFVSAAFQTDLLNSIDVCFIDL
jgi:hypothetical protein